MKKKTFEEVIITVETFNEDVIIMTSFNGDYEGGAWDSDDPFDP